MALLIKFSFFTAHRISQLGNTIEEQAHKKSIRGFPSSVDLFCRNE
jgi:hypothetical protein